MNGIDFNLLGLCGRGYAIEYCAAAFRKEQEEKAYRVYMSDAVRGLAQIQAKRGGADVDVPRFADLVAGPKQAKKEETAEEVLERIKKNLMGMGD